MIERFVEIDPETAKNILDAVRGRYTAALKECVEKEFGVAFHEKKDDE